MNETPELCYKMYRGEFERDPASDEFVNTDNPDAMDFWNAILKAFWSAFHISYEAMIIMGPDEYSDQDYLNELNLTNKDWFLGSETHLWNTAIKKNFKNLERIIKTPDHQYRGHCLKL